MAEIYDPEFPTSDDSLDCIKKENIHNEKNAPLLNPDWQRSIISNDMKGEDSAMPALLESGKIKEARTVADNDDQLNLSSQIENDSNRNAKENLKFGDSDLPKGEDIYSDQLKEKVVNGLDPMIIKDECSSASDSTAIASQNNSELLHVDSLEKFDEENDSCDISSDFQEHSSKLCEEKKVVDPKENCSEAELSKTTALLDNKSQRVLEVSSEKGLPTSRRRSTRIQIRRNKNDSSDTGKKLEENEIVALKNASKKSISDSVSPDNVDEINENEKEKETLKKLGRKPRKINAKEKVPEKNPSENQTPSPPVDEPSVTNETPKPKVGRPRKNAKVVNQVAKSNAVNSRKRKTNAKDSSKDNSEPKGDDAEKEITDSLEETIEKLPNSDDKDTEDKESSNANLEKNVKKLEKIAMPKRQTYEIPSENAAEPGMGSEVVRRSQRKRKNSEEKIEVVDAVACAQNEKEILEKQEAESSTVIQSNSTEESLELYDDLPAPENETATPAPENETATPAPENETVTPAPENETVTPAPENETATPAPENEIATPAPENEIATPAPENEIATPAPENEIATPAPENEIATPAPENETATPVISADTALVKSTQSNLVKVEEEIKRPEKVKSRWRRSCELENLVPPSKCVTVHRAIQEEPIKESNSMFYDERTKNVSDLPSEPFSITIDQSPNVSTKSFTNFPNSPDFSDKNEKLLSETSDSSHSLPSSEASVEKIENSELSYLDSSNELNSKITSTENSEKLLILDDNKVQANLSSTVELVQNESANQKSLECDSMNFTISANTFTQNIPVSSSSSISSHKMKSDTEVSNDFTSTSSECDIIDSGKLDHGKKFDINIMKDSSSVDLETLTNTGLPAEETNYNEAIPSVSEVSEKEDTKKQEENSISEDIQFPDFEPLLENRFISERKKSRGKKEVKRMQCECYLSVEELENNFMACGDDCLNRLLMIECGSRCRSGQYCANKKFQKREYVHVVPFKTEMKGFGLKTLEDISSGQFIIEYVGEVLNHKEFKQRVKQYSKEKCAHYYFMSLRADEILDATFAGNVSRFINHSCSPNIETQKWTVNGELRIGFFSKKNIASGEELTFDYQFQRYGREAQKCFCESENCRGFIGGEKQVSLNKTTKVVSKKKKTAEELKRELFEDMDLDMEVEKLNSPKGLKNRDDVLKLCRLMVRAEDNHTRETLLSILQNTTEQACLRLFLDYHGLALIWSWMANISEDCIEIKSQILETLVILPIQNITTLEDSKVLDVVKRWAAQLSGSQEPKEIKEAEVLTDGEASSSEPSSVAVSPRDSSMYKPPSKKIKLDSHEAEIVHDSNSTAHVFTYENIDINIDDIPLPSSPPPASIDYSLNMETDDCVDDVKSIASQCDDVKSNESQCDDVKSSTSQCNDVKSSKSQCDGMPDSSVNSEQKESQSGDIEPEGEDGNESLSTESGAELKSDDDSSQFFQQDDGTKEVASLAAKILESWSNLKEVFRIPKRENDQKVEEKDFDKKLYENSPDSSSNVKERKVLLPTPDIKPGKRLRKSGFGNVNKHQRRMKFALEMRQKDQEDAIRRQEEEIQRQEEERQQNRANLIFAAATAMCNDPTYQPPLRNVAELYPPTQPPTDLGLNLVTQPPPLPQDNLNVMYNPSQVIGPPVLPPTVLPPPTVPVPDVAISISSQQYPPIPTQQPPPYMQGPPMIPPPSTQTVPSIPSIPPQFTPGLPITQPPPQQPPPLFQPNLLPPRPAVPQMIAVSTPDSLHQYVQAQGPQILTAPPPGAPVYYIQHPGGQPTPVVIMPEAEAIKERAPPPPSPPKSRKDTLPQNWKTAKDSEGNTYYYHSITRKTQWDPPSWDQVEEIVEPSYPPEKHKHSRKKSLSTTTAAADTSSELVKKTKELFRAKMSSHIVHCLNPFRKPDCKLGRITSTEDFKHLARKLTHFVMAKELKYCQNVEDLECNENVKHKAKDFVNKYLTKYGPIYKKDKSSPKEY